MRSIRVCALTYKRPEGLARLLDGLAGLETENDWDLGFVIVDNDPAASARTRIEADNDEGPLASRLHYVHQAIQGIARSRNAALDAAGDADLVAFIDDDEAPEPSWLRHLVAAIDRYQADVVGGPVLPMIEGSPPDWIVAGRFFERRRYASGTLLGHVFTNNVLFRGSRQRELGIRFDERPRFAELRVGEDRLFFQALRLAGARTVWCDEAIVREWIPADRASADWLAERMRKIGLATAAVELELDSSIGRRLLIASKALVWLAIGSGRAILAGGDEIRKLKTRRALSYARGLLEGLRS